MAVMSFAHLKKSNDSAVAADTPKNDLQGHGDVFRTFYAVPAIMPTARIASVNLCRCCPRFIKESDAAENNLKKSKAGYGFCLRDSDSGGEEYIAIPAKATVDRCYINMMWDK